MDIDKALNDIVSSITPLQKEDSKLPYGAKCYCKSCTPFLFDPGILLVPSSEELEILEEELLVLLTNIGWPLSTKAYGVEENDTLYRIIRENLEKWVWGRFVCPHAAGEWKYNTQDERNNNFKRILNNRGIVCSHNVLVTHPNAVVQVQTKLSTNITKLSIKPG